MSTSIGAPEPAAPPPKTNPGRRAAFFGLDTLIPGSSLYLLAQGLQRRNFYGRADLAGFAWQRLVFRAGTPAEGPQDAALSFVAGKHRPELRALAREIADERIVIRCQLRAPDGMTADAQRLDEGRTASRDLVVVPTIVVRGSTAAPGGGTSNVGCESDFAFTSM